MKHHVYAVGIDQYDRYGPLSYCANDAELFAEAMQSLTAADCVVLTARRGGRLDKKEVSNLINQLPRETYGPEDVITFYFAGHGMAEEGADYFLTSDSDPRSLETLVPTVEVIQALRESRAGLALFILDACRVPGPNRTGSRFGDGTREKSKKLGIVSVFGCAPNQTCQESGQLDQGHGVFTYALVDMLKDQRELVPLNANRLLPLRVRELTEKLGLAQQEPEIALSNLNSATRDIISGREIRIVERPKRMLILAGLPNAGKSTIGARLARTLGFQHVEMSSYANSAFLRAVENRDFDGTLQEYMMQVFWADGQDDRVASELLSSNPDLDGLVITGPRKPAEVETLQDAGYATELIYVYADSRTRHNRHILNAAQYGGAEQLLSLTGFVHRDLLENSWGLPKIGLMENCRIIENSNLEAAIDRVERRMRQRRWGDIAIPDPSRSTGRWS